MYLVGNLQVRKERYVSRPLDGAKQQSGGQFADVLDAHEVAARLTAGRRDERAAGRALSAAAGEAASPGRVRLGAQQHRHEARQVAAAAGAAVTRAETHAAAGRRVGRRAAAQPARHHAPRTAAAAVEVVVIGRTVEHLGGVTEPGVMKARRDATFLYCCTNRKRQLSL